MALPPARLLLVAAILAAGVGLAAGAAIHLALRPARGQGASALPSLHGQAVWPAGRRRAPGFTLRDQTGRPVSLAAEHDRSVLLAFMDPLCRQECPIEGRGISLVERQVEPAERAAVLIVSVNPAATAADARRAARKWGISGDWHWLLGTRSQLARVWRAYEITVVPKSNDVVHSTALYVIDRHGFERAGVIAPFLPQFVADDLRTLAGSAKRGG